MKPTKQKLKVISVAKETIASLLVRFKRFNRKVIVLCCICQYIVVFESTKKQRQDRSHNTVYSVMKNDCVWLRQAKIHSRPVF